MKIKTMLCFVTAGLLVGCASEKEEHAEKQAHKQARLMAEAKVSKEDAEKMAMAKIPDGTIKEAELEKEHGKLQWSFDMTMPGSSDITEVNVDAISGGIISIGKESAEKDKD